MNEILNINIYGLAAAAFASFMIGFLWYSILFTKPWMEAMGVTTEDVRSSGISMPSAIFASLAASIATAAGISILFALVPIHGWATGLLMALVVWFAFSLTPMFKFVFWEDRPAILFVIDGGYEFFSIFSIAIILLAWA